MRAKLIEATNRHPNDWWMRGRTDIILELIKNRPRDNKICDIGSGTGLIADEIKKRGFKNIFTTDASSKALSFLKEKGFKTKKMVLPQITLKETFDLVLLLDVLEHVEEDQATLNNLQSIIKPDGEIIITVPAFQFLWSSKDEEVWHKRRYSKSELKQRLLRAGYKIKYLTYYNFFLFLPAVIFSKLNRKRKKINRYSTKQDKIFYPIFSMERNFIKRHFHFPFGVSLLAVVAPK